MVAEAVSDAPPAPGASTHWRAFVAQYGLPDSPLRPCADEGFDLAAQRTGNYELSERCPHVLPGNRQGASRAGAR